MPGSEFPELVDILKNFVILHSNSMTADQDSLFALAPLAISHDQTFYDCIFSPHI
jgi:hypothetical protein